MLGRVLVMALVLASSRSRVDEVADLVAKGEARSRSRLHLLGLAPSCGETWELRVQ